MSGTHVDPDELTGLAGKLRNAATSLDEAPSPPPAPDVGEATEAVAGALALLTSSTAGIVEGLGATGDAVAEGRDLYEETDHSNAERFDDQPG